MSVEKRQSSRASEAFVVRLVEIRKGFLTSLWVISFYNYISNLVTFYFKKVRFYFVAYLLSLLKTPSVAEVMFKFAFVRNIQEFDGGFQGRKVLGIKKL